MSQRLRELLELRDQVNEQIALERAKGGRVIENPKVRAWAKANGYEIGRRGRIPREVRRAYLAAHP